MKNSDEPIACTLSDVDAVQQAKAWEELGAQAVSTERLSSGIRMTFPAALAAKVEDMAASELECCSFLSIETTHSGDQVSIEISSDNPDARPVVDIFQGLIPEAEIS